MATGRKALGCFIIAEKFIRQPPEYFKHLTHGGGPAGRRTPLGSVGYTPARVAARFRDRRQAAGKGGPNPLFSRAHPGAESPRSGRGAPSRAARGPRAARRDRSRPRREIL